MSLYRPQEMHSWLHMSALIAIIVTEQCNVRVKLDGIRQQGSSISIADMFDLQIRMNRLSQFTEMSSALVSAANTCLNDLSRAIKQ